MASRKENARGQITRKIYDTRAELAKQYVELLTTMDESRAEQWAPIISAARDAGLEKAALTKELSCSWSTILRWQAGDTLPGPFARHAIKAKLIEMISSQAQTEHSLARERAFA
jgi:hypothetical protein